MPASTKVYDLVVFGATGFTGKYIVEFVAKTLADAGLAVDANRHPRWAVAGRSEKRLRDLVNETRELANQHGSGEPDVLIADVQDPQSLADMCAKSKVVINAVGPFRFFGEQVVKACIDNKADYVDITGEPEFFERMQHQYHERAKENDVLIVNCCGFDSVPADMSVIYSKQQLQRRNATPSSIEMYFSVKSKSPNGFAGNYATYESAVHGIGNAAELRKLRKETKRVQLEQVGPRLKVKGGVSWDERVKSWVVPFFFADPSVIRLTQMLESEYGAACSSNGKPVPPVQFAGYIQIQSTFYLCVFVIFSAVFALLATKEWGRDLLLKHPKFFTFGVFSRNGPTLEQIKSTTFTSRFYVAGYSNEAAAKANKKPDVSFITECTGPEPGYDSTPICVANCAYTILRDKTKLRLPRGVITPAVAFGKTDLVDRLTRDGVSFTVVDKSS